MSYGDDVRAARKAKRLTQDEAAKLAGVSKRYYNDIENNRANVSLDILLKVVRALDVRQLRFGDVVAAFGSSTIEEKLEQAALLVRDVRDSLRASGYVSLADFHDAAAATTKTPAAFSFAGQIQPGEIAARAAGGMPAGELVVPEALFRAVDFSYPTPAYGTLFRAVVLGDSMEPLLSPGDTIHIHTSIRTLYPGLIFAVHSPIAGSVLGRVPPGGDPLLLRAHGEPVLLGADSCVILGAVEKVA